MARQRFTVAHLADDRDVGCHPQEPADKPPKVDGWPIGTRRAGLHRRDVGERDVGLEDLLRDHHANEGSSSPAQQLRSVVLPLPGAPAKTMLCLACTHAARKSDASAVIMPRSTS